MCLEFPGRVVSVDASSATVDQEGRVRRASTLLFPDLKPGDWVFVAAGTVIQRLGPAEAESIRATLLDAIEITDAEARTPALHGGTP